MIDLVCLVADKNMEAALAGILERPRAIGTSAISHEIHVHPRRDPGCFHEAAEFLLNVRDGARHALVLLDAAWSGAPASTGAELERLLEADLARRGLAGWARAVVIDPELEAWVWSDTPHVARALGWEESSGSLRTALEARSFWKPGAAKPSEPKPAMEWALRVAKKPRSSAIYRELASKVGFVRCGDRSFVRLVTVLREWFPGDTESA